MADKSIGGRNGSKSSTALGPSPSRQQSTPSPPLNEGQSPQLQGNAGGDAGTSAGERQPPNRTSLHMSGMRSAQSLAEWQLQAVLFRARLTQYFDVFISQGGDDIDQIMQCDETEFLEIMSLVGMASKPLHVRRLQRTLSEFSLNRAQFLVATVPFIGLPPIDFPSTSSTDNLTAALQFLVPGYLPGPQFDLANANLAQQPPSDFLFGPSTSNASSPSHLPPSNAFSASSSLFSLQKGNNPLALPLPGLADQFLLSLVNSGQGGGFLPNQQFIGGKRARMSFSPPSTPKEESGGVKKAEIGEEEPRRSRSRGTANYGGEQATPIPAAPSPASPTPSSDRLTDSEIGRLGQFAREMIGQVPRKLEPRTGQGKHRMERGLLEAISLPPEDPLRLEHFRLFARIYGRFDAKRRPDKALTRHERIVNEAAAQLSLLRPDLLARRDILFPLARKLARMVEMPPGSAFQQNIGIMEPGSPERSCSGASSTAESTTVETPNKEERGEMEAEAEGEKIGEEEEEEEEGEGEREEE